MAKKIVIVESPGKINTIQQYLGPKFRVVATNGHVRDLPKKNLGVDIDNGFQPTYVINPDKRDKIATLKKMVAGAPRVYLASDDDREGEAISWHTKEVLGLSDEAYERVVFRSITKAAIQEAFEHPRKLNHDLVDAQQARRLLDRLVGYKLSEVLWVFIKGGISAGRVQSVTLRLIVSREREISAFQPLSRFKVAAEFALPNGHKLIAELPSFFTDYAEALAFVKRCQGATFTITDLKETQGERSPGAPLSTSSLQRIAAQELGFSIKKTMILAQKLYEKGKVTYIRTDSIALAPEALSAAKRTILKQFGPEYHHARQYKTKSANAQEAHEAIRPTNFQAEVVSQDSGEQRLYTLIRRRTLASQMAKASVHKTTATINISTTDEPLVAKGEVIAFPGFLALYPAGAGANQNALPPLNINQKLQLNTLQAAETFTRPPARYSEGSLVKKLKDLGIGRPSTYLPTIMTVQQRGYVEKENREGVKREYRLITLTQNEVTTAIQTEMAGQEKQKLFPTSLGVTVSDFLCKHFEEILDYAFTANTEGQLDDIAHQKISWKKMLGQFYPPFSKQIQAVLAQREDQRKQALPIRELGKDPATGKPILARLSRRYGPLVQIGGMDDEEKPRFASLKKGQLIDQITLEEALELFKLPRTLGAFEEEPVIARTGRFGPYIEHKKKFCSIRKPLDPYDITLPEAIKLIKDARERNKPIKTFAEDDTIQVLAGRFGPYIKTPKKNVRIPKDQDPATLTWEQCQTLIKKAKDKPTRRRKK
ncbi:MAG: type I DNA topoisomerase [Cytophagales bacterium]